jgi:hypothetical protein
MALLDWGIEQEFEIKSKMANLLILSYKIISIAAMPTALNF